MNNFSPLQGMCYFFFERAQRRGSKINFSRVKIQNFSMSFSCQKFVKQNTFKDGPVD